MYFLRDSIIYSYYKRTWPFSATVLLHTTSLGCYQGPRDVLLALSTFAVDSLTPSYRHSQHPPRAPTPHHFSQLLQAKSSFTCMSRPIPVPASISFMHLFLGCPLLLYPQHHLLLQTSTLIT